MALIWKSARDRLGVHIGDGRPALAILAWLALITAIIAVVPQERDLPIAIAFAALAVVLIERVLRRAWKR